MDWSVFLTKAGQLLLSLSILVVLHEFGHFLPAKLFKTKVEKFYLFFNPWFSLFKKKIGDTVYGIGWLPLGGYVKIAGMVDESMDTEQLKSEPQPWEFRSKPAWQRLIIMVGGVTVNLIFAMLIYAMLLFKNGEEYLPMENATYGVWVQDSLGYRLGLENGDHILSMDGKPVTRFTAFEGELILEEVKTIQVRRGDERVELEVPDGFIRSMIQNNRSGMALIAPRVPTVVQEVQLHSEAERIGLLPGDQLVAVDSTETPFFDQFREELARNKGQEVPVVYIRNGMPDTVLAAISEEGFLGFRPDMNVSRYFETKVKKFGFFASFPAGITKAVDMLGMYVKQFRLIFFSDEVKASESLGGFYSIGNIFPSQWNWVDFWNLTALLSIILAFMNILPIPALDGGHVMFLVYEIIVGRPPNEKFLQYAQVAGMLLLLALMLYVNGLDILRIFGK